MRTLKFNIIAQRIERDPTCDFSGIVSGTKGYLQAWFSFSSEWAGCKKVAAFYRLGKEYAVPIAGNICAIPAEVLTWSRFEVAVIGERDGYRITTNKIEITQERRRDDGDGR